MVKNCLILFFFLIITQSTYYYHRFLLAYSELPAFLVQDGGLNSGFMIAHCTAAALGKKNLPIYTSNTHCQLLKISPSDFSFKLYVLVSENKTLCHPASVDSLSTSAGTEDHVSMGGFAARKALQVVRNVEKVDIIDFKSI